MYAPISDFLKEQRGCEPVWQVGQGKSLRIQIPDPFKRIPDVVGARAVSGGWETHVVEAKPRQGGGAAVPQALAQLQAISPWADYLYLALEQADWDERTGPQQRNLESQLGNVGCGLLLVDDEGSVTLQIEPSRNKGVDRQRRDELLTMLEIHVEPATVFNRRLGTEAAGVAAGCVAATV